MDQESPFNAIKISSIQNMIICMSLLYIFLSSVIQLPFGAKLPELQTLNLLQSPDDLILGRLGLPAQRPPDLGGEG